MNTINNNSVSFAVAVVRIERAIEVLTVANKKIVKLGLSLPLIKWSLSPAFERTIEVNGVPEQVLFQTLTVENLPSRLGLSSWALVASLEHFTSGNVIHARSGEELPLQYRATDFTLCEHCNIKRARNKTLVVRHVDNNEFKQVGTSCLKDFLGHDVQAILALIENIFDGLNTATSSVSHDEVDASRRNYRDLFDVVSYSFAVVARNGSYVSRETADMKGIYSTSALVQMQLGQDAKDRDFVPSKEDREIAQVAIDWVLSQTGTSDTYMHNLRVICESGYVTHKNINFAVSIVAAWHREQEKQRKAQEVKIVRGCSQHQGVVGEKLSRALVITRTFQNSFSVAGHTTFSTMYLMRDDEGNAYKCSSGVNLGDEGDCVFVVASVKEHSEYKGIKQTVLQRPKKTEALEDLTPKPKGTRGRKPKAKALEESKEA